MRVLAVTHGPLVGPSCSAMSSPKEGHELTEWDIARRASRRTASTR